MTGFFECLSLKVVKGGSCFRVYCAVVQAIVTVSHCLSDVDGGVFMPVALLSLILFGDKFCMHNVEGM